MAARSIPVALLSAWVLLFGCRSAATPPDLVPRGDLPACPGGDLYVDILNNRFSAVEIVYVNRFLTYARPGRSSLRLPPGVGRVHAVGDGPADRRGRMVSFEYRCVPHE